MTTTWVLDEDDALEVLAYLVTAARTQCDEAAEYGPMRLLTAAHRLAERMAPRSSEETRALVTGPLQLMPPLAVPRGEDREGYMARLDDVCRAMGEHLAARYASDPTST